MSLLDILQGVGHVLDTPGSVVRGLLSGDTDRAFGGIFDPSRRVSGRDLTNAMGLTDEDSGIGGDIAGLAAGVATDPLTWGGGALLRLLGRGGETAAAGARAGVGAEANAAGKAATAAAGAGVKAKSAYNPYAAGSPTLTAEDLGVADYLTPNSLVRKAESSVPVAEGGSTIGDMLDARRRFTAIKDLGLDKANNPTYRAVGGIRGAGAERAHDVHNAAIDSLAYLQKHPSFEAFYSPSEAVAVMPKKYKDAAGPISRFAKGESAFPEAITNDATLNARHEIGHGILHERMAYGDTSNLPAQWRAAGAMQQSENPVLSALGLLTEESAMHGVGAGRGLLKNLGGQMQFWSAPGDYYLEQIGRRGAPAVSDLFSSMLLPRTALAGYGTAAAGGASALAALLGGNE